MFFTCNGYTIVSGNDTCIMYVVLRKVNKVVVLGVQTGIYDLSDGKICFLPVSRKEPQAKICMYAARIT